MKFLLHPVCLLHPVRLIDTTESYPSKVRAVPDNMKFLAARYLKQLTVLSSIIPTNNWYTKISIHQVGYIKFILANAIWPVHVLLFNVYLDFILTLLEQNLDKIWITFCQDSS